MTSLYKPKYLIIGLLLLFIGAHSSVNAQVNGLSYTISPSVEYNLFNDQSGISNGFLGGAQLGFGFGQLVELRGLYLQGFDLTTDINRFGVDVGEGVDTSFMGNPLDLQRYGAEIKVNLGRSALSPFVVAGTGIQSIAIEGQESNKQIYLSGGLGLQLAIADRYTITLQGLRNSYRSNAVQQLLGEDELSTLGLDPADFDDTDYSSWAGRASLLLYLGGRKPGSYSDTDRAYADQFKRGFSLAIEPTVNRMNFNEVLPFRDTYLAGAFAGFDFGPLIGVRGFYMQALEEGSRTKFDNLAVIGGEARFRFGNNKGLTPFFSVGGGQIRPGDDYEGNGNGTLSNQAFASGGGGLNLSLGTIGNLTAYGRTMLTSNEEITEISTVDAINNSWSYGVSLNFLIGGNVRPDESDDDYDFFSEDDDIKNLKKDIAKLDRDLDKAIQMEDRNRIMSITREREIALQRLSMEGQNSDRFFTEERESNKKKRSIKDMSDEEFMMMLGQQNKPSERSSRKDESRDVQSEIDRIMKDRDDEENKKRTDNEIRELREELKNLYKDTDRSTGNRNNFSSDVQDQIDELREAIEDIQNSERDRKEEEYRREQKEAYDKEMQSLRDEIKNMKSRDDNSKKDNAYSKEIQELRRELKDMRNDRGERQSRNNDSNEEIRELREALDELRDGGQRSEKSQDDSDSMIKEMEREIEKLKNERDTKSASDSRRAEMIERRKGDLQDEIERLENEYDRIDDENSDEAKILKSETNKLKKELKRLKDGQVYNESGSNYIDDEGDLSDYVDSDESYWYLEPNSPRARSVFESDEGSSGFFNKLRYNGASGIAGISVGGNSSLNLGYRMHYIIDGKKNLEFMPETYFGFSSPSNFGILANLNYHLKGASGMKKGIRPYVGAGAGIIKTGNDEDADQIRPVINLLVGSALDVMNGKLYVDFSTRNFLKYNQIVAGYKFPF